MCVLGGGGGNSGSTPLQDCASEEAGGLSQSPSSAPRCRDD